MKKRINKFRLNTQITVCVAVVQGVLAAVGYVYQIHAITPESSGIFLGFYVALLFFFAFNLALSIKLLTRPLDLPKIFRCLCYALGTLGQPYYIYQFICRRIETRNPIAQKYDIWLSVIILSFIVYKLLKQIFIEPRVDLRKMADTVALVLIAAQILFAFHIWNNGTDGISWFAIYFGTGIIVFRLLQNLADMWLTESTAEKRRIAFNESTNLAGAVGLLLVYHFS